MGFRNKIRRLPREAFDEPVEIPHVRSKFHGGRAPGLLIQFRSGPEAMRPGDGRPERDPLQKQSGSRDGTGFSGPLTHVEAKTVAQVADHAVSGHRTPATLAGGLNCIQSTENFFFVGLMEESLHIQNLSSRHRMPRAKIADHP